MAEDEIFIPQDFAEYFEYNETVNDAFKKHNKGLHINITMDFINLMMNSGGPQQRHLFDTILEKDENSDPLEDLGDSGTLSTLTRGQKLLR